MRRNTGEKRRARGTWKCGPKHSEDYERVSNLAKASPKYFTMFPAVFTKQSSSSSIICVDCAIFVQSYLLC